jgi:hypothetical protein
MTDPEETTAKLPADLQETVVDDADEISRPLPVEADPADVVEQRMSVPDDDERRED